MFGCGEAPFDGTLAYSSAVTENAYTVSADRLRNSDGLDRDHLDWLRETRLKARAVVLGAAGVFGLLAGPLWAATGAGGGGPAGHGHGRERPVQRVGNLHVVPSTPETVRLGVLDATLPPIVEIEPGDVVVYPDTWSHFLNRLQPGVPIEDLGQWRRENPGKGPHSIVGPVHVHGSQPGDMLAIEFQRLIPVDWGASFVNPADLGTGTLPEQFPEGQVRYLSFDLRQKRAEFVPGISVELQPFQGTFGVAPLGGGVTSSVPPGQHAGNIDLRDLVEGSTLYIPVWQPGAMLFTGDSHALQGDGEVNNQAVESAMREVRVRVSLHQQAGWSWPFAETDEHWIALGIHADLNEAFRIATRNTIEFLQRKASLSALDAYSLASIAISFRVTQFVNQTRGVHALIPRALFSDERRRLVSIV